MKARQARWGRSRTANTTRLLSFLPIGFWTLSLRCPPASPSRCPTHPQATLSNGARPSPSKHPLPSQQTSPAYSHPRRTHPRSNNKAIPISFILASCRRVSTETTAICMLMPLTSSRCRMARLSTYLDLSLFIHKPPLKQYPRAFPHILPIFQPLGPKLLKKRLVRRMRPKRGG